MFIKWWAACFPPAADNWFRQKRVLRKALGSGIFAWRWPVLRLIWRDMARWWRDMSVSQNARQFIFWGFFFCATTEFLNMPLPKAFHKILFWRNQLSAAAEKTSGPSFDKNISIAPCMLFRMTGHVGISKCASVYILRFFLLCYHRVSMVFSVHQTDWWLNWYQFGSLGYIIELLRKNRRVWG
jgi:hypothetical protein